MKTLIALMFVFGSVVASAETCQLSLVDDGADQTSAHWLQAKTQIVEILKAKGYVLGGEQSLFTLQLQRWFQPAAERIEPHSSGAANLSARVNGENLPLTEMNMKENFRIGSADTAIDLAVEAVNAIPNCTDALATANEQSAAGMSEPGEGEN